MKNKFDTLQDAPHTPTHSHSSVRDTLQDTTAPSPAPGEQNFMSRLNTLARETGEWISKASTLQDRIQTGDRLYWQGAYDRAVLEYKEALMLAQDEQSKASLLNKLARTQLHRQNHHEALDLLQEALETLGESLPQHEFLQHTRRQWLQLRIGMRSFFGSFGLKTESLWPATVEYGERSHAILHLYRELAHLAQGENDALYRYALVQQSFWAERLDDPLEKTIAWGRLGEHRAQHHRFFSYEEWASEMKQRVTEKVPLTRSAADFYLGRVAFLCEQWEDARTHLEQCIEHTTPTRDDSLYEAALQHLIRVYRKDGNFAKALDTASKLLEMYLRLGHIARLSACCRHFALIFAAYGDLQRAQRWAEKALAILDDGDMQSSERSLSQLRCYVLLADLEQRRGQHERARRYLGGAIRLQRDHNLAPIFLHDGMKLLRKLRGEKQLPESAKVRSTREHGSPELAYLYQEYTGEERHSGLNPTLRASQTARRFLEGEGKQIQREVQQDSGELDSLFPVGAVSSRWGRGNLAQRFTGNITTDFSDASKAPWGYFFADDIQD